MQGKQDEDEIKAINLLFRELLTTTVKGVDKTWTTNKGVQGEAGKRDERDIQVTGRKARDLI